MRRVRVVTACALAVMLAVACTRNNSNALDRSVSAPTVPSDGGASIPFHPHDLAGVDLRDRPHDLAGNPHDFGAVDLASSTPVDLAWPAFLDLASSGPADLAGSNLLPCDCRGLQLISGNQCPLTSQCVGPNCCLENTIGLPGFMCTADPTCAPASTPQ
jgi:hypothetical protein